MDIRDTINLRFNHTSTFHDKLLLLGELYTLDETIKKLEKELTLEIVNNIDLQSNLLSDRTFRINSEIEINYSINNLSESTTPVDFNLKYVPKDEKSPIDTLVDPYEHLIYDPKNDDIEIVEEDDEAEEDEFETDYDSYHQKDHDDSYVSFDQIFNEVKEREYIDNYNHNPPEEEYWGDFED